MKSGRYAKHGKILTPLTDEEFNKLMETGHYVRKNHKAFVILLWYTGVRKLEALRAKKEQFKITDRHLIFSVGKRLKFGMETAPLKIPVDAPYVSEVIREIEQTKQGKRVFQFSPRTAYNICDRIGYYPHFFRLSRITNLFDTIDPKTDRPFTIAVVHSFTGLAPHSLRYYIGLVDIDSVAESFKQK